MKEINIPLKLSLDNYPLLSTIKEDELPNFIQNVFDYGYKILYPEVDNQLKYKSELEAQNRKEIIGQIQNLRDEISDNCVDEKIEHLSQILEKFLGLSNNSNKKGEITEDIIYQILTSKYKDLSYEKTRHIPHSGDGVLTFPNKLKTLVEIKNYSSTVKKEEIDKFEYDLKYNNIHFGLFISLKSSIQGHSQLSYQKMVHDDKEFHMVFVSHLSNEMSKLDASILVLNKLYEINKDSSNHTNLDWIQNQINSHFKELIKVSEKTSFLKDNYLSMESTIKNSLNNYYVILRDYQYEMDDKINQIWQKMNSDFGKVEDKLLQQSKFDDVLEKYKDDKCFHILTKVFDQLKENQFNLIEITEKQWQLINKNNETLGEIKKSKTKLTVCLNNPCLELFFVKNKDTENDKNLKFMNLVLNNNL